MRSQDRTLLASFGFADPDLRNEDHEMACIYLSGLERMEALAKIAIDRDVKLGLIRPADYFFEDGEYGKFSLEDIKMERVISKGDGQYKTAIGFVDVWGVAKQAYGYRETKIGVEVKGHPVPVSSILKQIGLYREYLEDVHWFLAACYPLSDRDMDALRTHEITPVQLGSKFRAWRDAALSDAANAERKPVPEI